MNIPIERIIQDGVRAPSGENCQPWKFVVSGNKISVFNIPEADTSLYNVKQHGSYIAHGALLENMRISAEHYGCTFSVSLFPTVTDETHVADVLLREESIPEGGLYDAIAQRCTNRKDFTGKALTVEEKQSLIDATESLSLYGTLRIIDDPVSMKELGQALSLHEKVLFENKSMHDFFYEHIIWDKKNEDAAGGFYIDTLEFLPHQRKAVKLFKNWSVLVVMNTLLKVARAISKENGEKYAASGSFGILTMRATAKEDYVHLGMLLERFWLTATRLGIAVHPCNGTLYLMDYIKHTSGECLSMDHKNEIHGAYNTIVSRVNKNDDGHISFIVRLGKADAPTAVATRKTPSIVWIDTIKS
jgi:nitroreductase